MLRHVQNKNFAVYTQISLTLDAHGIMLGHECNKNEKESKYIQMHRMGLNLRFGEVRYVWMSFRDAGRDPDSHSYSNINVYCLVSTAI